MSPDRMLSTVFTDQFIAGLECKVPYTTEKWEKIAEVGDVPKEYRAQCHWGVFITGLPWVFIAYDPRSDQLFETPLKVGAAYLAEMMEKADKFCEKLESGGQFEAFTSSAKNLKRMFQ